MKGEEDLGPLFQVGNLELQFRMLAGVLYKNLVETESWL